MPAADGDRDSLTEEISREQPCGPDLDEEEDDAYVNFLSTIEVVLPTDYLVADHDGVNIPFHSHGDFKEINLPRWISTARELASRTRDLRILSVLARLHALNRSIAAFETVVDAMATLLETAWDDVHPRPKPGADAFRPTTVERLDEPVIVAALQHAVLFSSKRYGALTWQGYRAAVRKSSGNSNGTDTSAVDRVLLDECSASPNLVVPIRDVTDKLVLALARIRAVFSERCPGTEPELTRISGAVAELRAFFERIQPITAPSRVDREAAGEVEPHVDGPRDAPAPESAYGAISSSRQASAALDAAIIYLSDAEPSSPALLLLRQAQALVGKPFLDAMQALFPEQVRHAGVTVAVPSIFRLTLTQLAENGRPPDGEGEGNGASAEEPSFSRPRSRSDTLMLLDAVASFYRSAEPSSPIPMLVDRARPLLGQDFMALVRSMLPVRLLSDE